MINGNSNMVHTTYTVIQYEIVQFDKDVVGYVRREVFTADSEAEAIEYYMYRAPQICSWEKDSPVKLQLCIYTDVKRDIFHGGV